VKQAGSSVDRARLRFDFSHFAGVAEEELAQVEEIVNRQVLANTAVETLVDVRSTWPCRSWARWRSSVRSTATGFAW